MERFHLGNRDLPEVIGHEYAKIMSKYHTLYILLLKNVFYNTKQA